jgi:Ca2+-binding RTX toxin-like protein
VFTEIAQSTNAASDLIADLKSTDVIDLTAIDADTGTAGVQAFHLTHGFSGDAGELVLTYDAGADVTRIQGDVDGDGQADFTILAAGDQSGFTRFAPTSDVSFDATLKGADGDDILAGTGLRELIIGLGGDDVLSGLGGDDKLVGGAGDDQLLGGSGQDTLDGGGGFDTVQGGSGDDLILLSNADGLVDGGSGYDIASFAEARFGVAASTGPAAAAEVLTGVEQLVGSAFADQLILTGKHEAAYGGGGTDVLVGADRSMLDGGAGDDSLTAGLHSQLDGGAGDDRLISWRADVQLTGGDGADVFAFAGAPGAGGGDSDLITDLDSTDTIDLSAIDADVSAVGDQAFILVSTLDGHAGEAALAYDAGADETALLLDTDGDGSADITIRLSGDHHDVTNFVL